MVLNLFQVLFMCCDLLLPLAGTFLLISLVFMFLEGPHFDLFSVLPNSFLQE